MLLALTEPYRQELEGSLVLKSVGDAQDVERLAVFNGMIHGQGVAAMTRELVLHHPHTRPEHWLFVEDEATGQVVSSLCLIPWRWCYEGVELQAGEMGIVGTSEPYRHQGLIRVQAARHAELLRRGEYDLSHIQGIPYFYRLFGYTYAIPLEGGWRVEMYLIPDAPAGEATRYDFRQATLGDLPTLTTLYEEASTDLGISTVRDRASWAYLLGPSLQTEMSTETWLVERDNGQPVGYFRVPRHGFGEGLIVNEVSHLSAEAALAVLRQLKALSLDRAKPHIRLNVPENTALVQAARYLGAHDLSTYAWQIRLVDVGRFLLKLAPVLERRIASSSFAGLTRSLCVNLYREAFELHFVQGKLVAVQPLGFSGRGEIRLPPSLAAPLLLGYRGWEELSRAHHDVLAKGEWQHIVDVLFPKVNSFIYTIY